MNYRNRALLNCAADAPCQNCGADGRTVVAAHSNKQIHGKGMGFKAHDCFVAFLCNECHDWYDGRSSYSVDPSGNWDTAERDLMFQRAMNRTWLWLWQNDKVRVVR